MAAPAGKALVDYAFHMIVTDPTPAVLKEELPALIGEGYTSFKIYMTYDDMKLDDRQILKLLAVARRHGALAMVHAENADCIAWLTETLEAAGHTAPQVPRDVAADGDRARGDASRDRLVGTGGRADPDRARVGPRGDRPDPLGPGPGPAHLRRDLPAVPLPHRRRPGRTATKAPSASAARRRATRRTSAWCGTGSRTACSPSSLRTTRRFASTIRRARSRAARRCRSSTSPTVFPVWRRGCRCCSPRACAPAASRSTSSSR